jgi:glycolate oxidase iron-sulfur subunit
VKGSRPLPDDLRDQLDTLLRHCIQCGLCLPTCATYLATGSEVQSPRGRLLLLGELLAAHATESHRSIRRRARRYPGTDTVAAFDLCLGCRACETACPSGISHELLDYAKELAAEQLGTGRKWLARDLSRRSTLSRLRFLATGTRSVLSRVLGTDWRRRFRPRPVALRRWVDRLGSLPTEPPDDMAVKKLLADLVTREAQTAKLQQAVSAEPVTADVRVVAGQMEPTPEADSPAGPVAGPAGAGKQAAAAESDGEREDADSVATESASAVVRTSQGPTVALFRGCANDVLLPGATDRLKQLLEAAGCQVHTPSGLACCGALDRHTGRPGRADQLRAKNAAVLFAFQDSWEFVVVEAAGCGLELKHYPMEIAPHVRDASEFLAALDLPPAQPVPLRVVLHDPCHARHGQGIYEQPRRLLNDIPELIWLEPEEAEVCCGSGGTYSLFHPEIAAEMGRRKAACLAATGADLVVTTNPGCLGHIAGGLALVAPELPILPLSDLLWFAHVSSQVVAP